VLVRLKMGIFDEEENVRVGGRERRETREEREQSVSSLGPSR
jgi:hypothetical protein